VTVEPATTEGVAGETVTVVTTGGGGGLAVTVTVDAPDLPALVAVIVELPAVTPVTTPLELTVAFPLSLDQATDWPDMTFPCASLTVACNVAVPPTPTETEGGSTFTLATLGGGGAGVAAVTAAAMFDSGPNVAPAFRAPRNATI